MAVGKIIKQLWRYTMENLAKGAISEKRLDSEIARLAKEATKRLKRIQKTDYNKLDYIQEVKSWIHEDANSVEEKRAKLSVIADFVGSDTSTVTGLRQTEKTWLKENADMIKDVKRFRGKGRAKAFVEYQNYRSRFRDRVMEDSRHGSSVIIRYMAYKGISQLDEEIKITEEIKRQMFDWHIHGEPDPDDL